jgi:hypothetical protein
MFANTYLPMFHHNKQTLYGSVTFLAEYTKDSQIHQGQPNTPRSAKCVSWSIGVNIISFHKYIGQFVVSVHNEQFLK